MQGHYYCSDILFQDNIILHVPANNSVLVLIYKLSDNGPGSCWSTFGEQKQVKFKMHWYL